MRHYTITDLEAGLRLDQYLTKAEPGYTRAFIQKLIRGGSVFIDHKKTMKPAHILKEGVKLIVLVPSIRDIGIQPENIPLVVAYEDKDMLVVNKAPGMVVHPTDHGSRVSGTLVNALLHHCKDLSGIGGEKRPGLVHRLDKDTSGLIMIAKNDNAHRGLAKQIESRSIEKRYIALLKGHLKPMEGSIEAPLLKTGAVEKDVRVSTHPKAKYALTHYKVIEYVGEFTLVQVHIITGRMHQIRVHFASIGHPVAGDDMYGDKKLNDNLKPLGLTRQFLHAAELKFKHPISEKAMHLTSNLPKDLKDLLSKLERQ